MDGVFVIVTLMESKLPFLVYLCACVRLSRMNHVYEQNKRNRRIGLVFFSISTHAWDYGLSFGQPGVWVAD